MNKFIAYPYSILEAFFFLWKGMYRTLHSFVHPKLHLTQEYPNNRETLYIPERFKAELTLLKDEEGKIKCTACGLCQLSCPNGSINLTSTTIQTEEGKNKRVLVSYDYLLGQCTFCGLCVDACNFDALAFTNDFEKSEYVKEKLDKTLYKTENV